MKFLDSCLSGISELLIHSISEYSYDSFWASGKFNFPPNTPLAYKKNFCFTPGRCEKTIRNQWLWKPFMQTATKETSGMRAKKHIEPIQREHHQRKNWKKKSRSKKTVLIQRTKPWRKWDSRHKCIVCPCMCRKLARSEQLRHRQPPLLCVWVLSTFHKSLSSCVSLRATSCRIHTAWSARCVCID